MLLKITTQNVRRGPWTSQLQTDISKWYSGWTSIEARGVPLMPWIKRHRMDILRFSSGYIVIVWKVVLRFAAASGHLHVVQWLYPRRRDGSAELNPPTPAVRQDKDRQVSTFRGSVRSMVDNISSHLHSPLDVAACHGHLHVVKFLHENHDNGAIAWNAMDLAAANGHLQVVQYLHQSRRGGCTDIAIYGALQNKHYDVVLYLYKHQAECRRWPKEEDLSSVVFVMLADPITPAIKALLRFFRIRRKFRLTPQVTDKASSDGTLDLVRTIHDLDLGECTTTAMDSAAEAGHLDVVRFLHENRFEGCTRMAINHVAYNGPEPVVRFLNEHRKEGCSPYAMCWATKNNHIGVVRNLIETKMPGDIGICLREATRVRSEIMIQMFTAVRSAYECQRLNSTRKLARCKSRGGWSIQEKHELAEMVISPSNGCQQRRFKRQRAKRVLKGKGISATGEFRHTRAILKLTKQSLYGDARINKRSRAA